jgi:hypothetical protein
MKSLIASILFAVSLSAIAASPPSIDTSKLTAEQVEQLKKQADNMVKEANNPANISASVRKEAEAWGDLGANMGKAMVGAAKEVGVAANEFSQTNLGKIVVFLAAYKIIGQDVLGVVFGSLILVFGYSLAVWVLTTRRWSKVKYDYEPIMWGMVKKARIISCETDDDTVTAKVLMGGILLIITTLIGLNTIF